jgi:hypothetical protein
MFISSNLKMRQSAGDKALGERIQIDIFQQQQSTRHPLNISKPNQRWRAMNF